MAKCCPDAYSLVTRNPNKWSKWRGKFVSDGTGEFTKEESLCIAVAWKDKRLIDRLIVDGASVWHRTGVFGLPLDVGIATRSPDIVKVVLHHKELAQSRVPSAVRDKLLSEKIKGHYWDISSERKDLSNLGQNRAIYRQLVEFYLKIMVKPCWKTSELLCKCIIRLKSEQLLKLLLEKKMSPKLRKESYPRAYFTSFPDPKML